MSDDTAEPLADEPVGLPFVDEHGTRIAAPRELVWTALRRYVDSSLVEPSGDSSRDDSSHLLGRLLGTEPRSGFAVAREVPNRHLGLAGRHRFARYLLVFEVADTDGGQTLLTARTYAAFPGPRGRIYRALVIGSRGHVVAVKRMLRSVRRLTTTAT